MINKDYIAVLILGFLIMFIYQIDAFFPMSLVAINTPLLLIPFSFIIWSRVKERPHPYFSILWKGIKISFNALVLSVLLLIIMNFNFRAGAKTAVDEILMELPKFVSHLIINSTILFIFSIPLALALYVIQNKEKESQTLDDHLLP